MAAPTYSLIVPLYNRRDEIAELLDSLAGQDCPEGTFEVLVVDDGSPEPSADIVARYPFARYLRRPNEGRSPARNHGMEQARGEWLVFVDSDCVLPADYFSGLDRARREHPEADCFGGPDDAHSSFSAVQKAINFAMTSMLTTGGIRGSRRSLEKFVPRTFNMGFRREVYERVGGFREMFSEDIDMSTRIREAGFRVMLFPDVKVWHKRRVSLRRFWRQVHVFGMSRITLHHLYPGSLKPVHTLPALAVLLGVLCVVLAVTVAPWMWAVPGAWVLAIFLAALQRTHSLHVALLAVPASFIQIAGYGTGFLRALLRPRTAEQQAALRRGK